MCCETVEMIDKVTFYLVAGPLLAVSAAGQPRTRRRA